MVRTIAFTITLLIVTALLVAFAGGTAWDVFVSGNNDFRAFYAGAQLAATRSLYSPEANEAVQARAGKIPSPTVAYIRPAFHAIMLWPLGRLPYALAYWLFQTVGLASLCIFLWLSGDDLPDMRRVGLAGPAILCLLCAQDMFLILTLATISVVCARKHRDYAAGVALGLCALKFHLFIFIPLVILRHHRWKIFVGALGTIGVLFSISLAISGVDWPTRYIAALSNPAVHANTSWMPNVNGLAAALGVDPKVAVILAILVAAAAVISIWKSPYELAFAVAIIAGVVATYHSYIYDCCLLLLALPRLMRELPRLSVLLAEFIGPIPYILLYIPVTHVLVLLLLAVVIAAPGLGGGHVQPETGSSRKHTNQPQNAAREERD